jgi:hypothetical protein
MEPTHTEEIKMRTLSLLAAAIAVALAASPAVAKSKKHAHRSYGYDAYLAYAEPYVPGIRKAARPHIETMTTIRANQADPTHQYDLPDWARAAMGNRGRR